MGRLLVQTPVDQFASLSVEETGVQEDFHFCPAKALPRQVESGWMR
jgi:hypothetical protein